MAYSATDYRPQVIFTARPVLAWSIMSGGALLFVAAIVVAPLAAAAHHDALAGLIYHSLGVFCHQIPDRSFFINGHKFAVCSRCTGIYFGFAIVLCLYPLVKSLRRVDLPPRSWLFAAAVPMAIDFSLTFFGLWENTHTTRFLTGSLLGGAAVFYVMPGVVELSLRNWRRSLTSPAVNHAEAAE